MPRIKGMQPIAEVFQFRDELPPAELRDGTIASVIPKLDENPGMWARIRGPYSSPESAKASAGHARSRFDGYEFFARKDNQDHMRWYLFARKVKATARR